MMRLVAEDVVIFFTCAWKNVHSLTAGHMVC